MMTRGKTKRTPVKTAREQASEQQQVGHSNEEPDGQMIDFDTLLVAPSEHGQEVIAREISEQDICDAGADASEVPDATPSAVREIVAQLTCEFENRLQAILSRHMINATTNVDLADTTKVLEKTSSLDLGVTNVKRSQANVVNVGPLAVDDQNSAVTHCVARANATIVPHNSDTRHVGAQDVGAQDVGAQDVGAQDVGAQNVGAQNVGTQYVGAHNVGLLGFGGQNAAAYTVTVPNASALNVVGLRNVVSTRDAGARNPVTEFNVVGASNLMMLPNAAGVHEVGASHNGIGTQVSHMRSVGLDDGFSLQGRNENNGYRATAHTTRFIAGDRQTNGNSLGFNEFNTLPTRAVDGVDGSASQYNLANQPSRMYPEYAKLVELPKFAGDPLEWPMFERSYLDTTAEFQYSDRRNLIRLRQTLVGEARAAV